MNPYCFALLLMYLMVVGISDAARAQSDSAATRKMNAEVAAERLAIPTNPVGRVTLQFKRWAFDPNTTEVARAGGYAVAFESSVPFAVGNGSTIRFRPNVPIYIQYPAVASSSGKIENRTGPGNITFDLAYGKRKESGLLLAYGVAATLPTAAPAELGNNRFTLGPEILIAISPSWGVIGIFPSHEWRVTGDGEFSRTNIQPILTLLPGGGWSVGTSPGIGYDWVGNKWSIPWSLGISKTSNYASSTWSYSVDIGYYGRDLGPAAPEWLIGLGITRVVSFWTTSPF